MANQKKYNHPEAPENIDIKEEIQKMVSDFRAWLKKAKTKLDTKPTYVKVLVYGAIAAFPALTYLIPDSMKTPEQLRIDKELKRGMDEYSNYVKKQEEERRRRWEERRRRHN